jgi:hypothetical protein
MVGRQMVSQTIFIIRHAEKAEAGSESGVDADGNADEKSLTPRGWQRAGAWAQLFLPALAQPSALPTPTALYASAPMKKSEIALANAGSRSRRSLETLTPLAAMLGKLISTDFCRGQEVQLAAAISNLVGVSLVCWQHEDIGTIARSLNPTPHGLPENWPKDRFNVMFRFDRADGGTAWSFRQIVPVLLAGDSAATI